MTIIINLKGRLGNQLFQYATLRNLSILKGFDFHIKTDLLWHGQQCLMDFFNIQNGNPPNNIIHRYSQPIDSNYFDENILNINDNTILDGHFENTEYFKENKEIIQNEITIKDENTINLTKNYIHEITNNGSLKLVGIHFRRGDLVQQINFLPSYKDIEHFNECQKQFTLESLETIKKKEKDIVLLIFTGGVSVRKTHETFGWIKNDQTDDLNWVKKFILENENNYNMHISPGTISENVLLDYSLLTNCDYIISPYQSTMSFMAYYSSKKEIEYLSQTNKYGDK